MLPAGSAFGAVFVYSAMCNLFPQGRAAKMAHLIPVEISFPFFFFYCAKYAVPTCTCNDAG